MYIGDVAGCDREGMEESLDRLIQPILQGKPVLFGPHMQNFAEMAREFKENKAALEVADAAGLEKALIFLMESPAERRALGEAAKALVAARQQSIRENLQAFLDTVKPLEVQ